MMLKNFLLEDKMDTAMMPAIRSMLDSYEMKINEPIEVVKEFNPLTMETSITLFSVKTRKKQNRILYSEDSVYENIIEMLDELYKEVIESC